MNSRVRSREELEQALEDQLAALNSSCRGYDQGDMWEGPRMATTVYTLVNNGNSRSVSVLSQLGIREKIRFISFSTPQIPGNLVSWTPLCTFRVGNDGVAVLPSLDKGPAAPKDINFKKWWGEAVFENAGGQKLSRMNLVFALRSQDGGSHYDRELPITPYLELKDNGGGWQIFSENAEEDGAPLQNAHLATMRHIAFEVEQSIQRYRTLNDQEHFAG